MNEIANHADGGSERVESWTARVWPSWLVVVLQASLFVLCVTPSIDNFVRFIFLMAGPLACFVLFSLAFVFFSRLRWWVSLSTLAFTMLLGIVAVQFSAPRTEIAYWMYGVPLTMMLISVGLLACRRVKPIGQLVGMTLLVSLGWGWLSIIRIDGIDGSYVPDIAFRWSPSSEQRLLANSDFELPEGSEPKGWEVHSESWPGFRGRNRDSRVTDPISPMDWEVEPPRERWRRPVGPGWSSMTVVSGRLFTQEQRGDDELVVCYDANTGTLIWFHAEPSRFEEVTSGAGPRATPTYADGRVFAYGAKGILVALDAFTGQLLWKRDLMQEVNAKLPVWGFSSSPAVFGDVVLVYAGGDGNDGLMALDCSTGETRWSNPASGMNFSSAQPATINGQSMAVFIQAGSARGLSPRTGEELWRYDIEGGSDPPIVQAQQITDDMLIVPLGDGIGVAAVSIQQEASGNWKATERWQSRNLKPSFNDFVYHDGALYGFDKEIFACIDASNGKRLWKRGRYGFGQAVILESCRQILVTTEQGEVVLVDAVPNRFQELGRIECLANKTWNHPVVAENKLYVRNSEEMVCYDLASNSR
ncbi:outer membrane biogenesis protein BamB [Bremerella volcania]|uniref:Outer membrane biogenesis protein BamB n=1 Tax=Bremerella volcania TaxID=2527984 RepID=A0A518CC61_9BACT|nr:PQQ-binding-like beta-propeller repeat protein [Bremerella volcania]QDU76807.1 outer membrane biogenesis protein BamB [Bremerella volcania]